MFPIEKIMLPNHYGREGHAPIIVVNHVSVGNKHSVISTFKNPANKVSSTFLNCRDGSIVQFCDITQKPKTNGNIRNPRSPLVRQMGGVNPNLYSVTIENEDAYKDDTPGVDGQLTEKQFISLCWLHKYIQTEVKRIYGVKLPLNSAQVIGHRDIDSVGKSFCPGNNFPFARLYKELAIAETMTLPEYEEHLSFKNSASYNGAEAFKFTNRIIDLQRKLTGAKWASESSRKLMKLKPVAAELGFAEGEEVTAELIAKKIIDTYHVSAAAKFEDNGFEKLMKVVQYGKTVGLL